MFNAYHNVSYPEEHQARPVETSLSAHSASLPTSDSGQAFSRASAAAALKEVYPPQRVEKALNFVQLVRLHLSDHPAAHDHLFKALKSFEEGRVELLDVLLRIMAICGHNPLLLMEINYFLPPGYSYSISMETQSVELCTPTQTLRQLPVPASQTR